MSIPQQVEAQKKIVEAHYDQQGEADTEVTTNTADTVAPDEQVTTAPVPQEDDYKQKYLSLQGKYNAEVPRLHQAMREQTARVQSLEQLLSTMQQRAVAPAPQQPQSIVTEDDREAYGDSIDVMRRVTQEETRDLRQQVMALNQIVRNMTNTVMPQVQEVQQRQARTDESLFWAELTSAVPNWREINDNDAFKDWLLEYDSLAGTTRQTLLELAHKNLDTQRVISFFTTWQSLQGAPQQRGAKRGVSQLEAQIAPGRGRSSSPPAQSTPKTVTAESIAKFYDDVRQGKFKGRDEERSRIEREIFAASKEGAIQ